MASMIILVFGIVFVAIVLPLLLALAAKLLFPKQWQRFLSFISNSTEEKIHLTAIRSTNSSIRSTQSRSSTEAGDLHILGNSEDSFIRRFINAFSQKFRALFSRSSVARKVSSKKLVGLGAIGSGGDEEQLEGVQVGGQKKGRSGQESKDDNALLFLRRASTSSPRRSIDVV